MDPNEIVEKLEWAKRLYDEAGALLLAVAEDQKTAMERSEPTLGIGGYLGAVADDHQQATAALLLATIKARESVDGSGPALPATASRRQRRERREKKAR